MGFRLRISHSIKCNTNNGKSDAEINSPKAIPSSKSNLGILGFPKKKKRYIAIRNKILPNKENIFADIYLVKFIMQL